MQLVHRAVNLLLFLVLLLIFLLTAAVAFAQKPIKSDVTLLFDKAAPPPTAFGPALKQPATLAELEKQIAQLSNTIMTARTAEQSQQEAATQAFGQQAMADGMEQMTDQQKMAYLQQNGAAMPGYNPQAMQMAQLMQDPAFQAKLAKMSDAEKAQFLQQQMMPAGSPAQRMTADPSFQAAQAEFMQQMRDPAFKKAWDKKSEAEQDAYMEQLMRKHGMNEAKMQAIAGKTKPSATAVGPLVTKAAVEAYAKMNGAVAANLQGQTPLLRVQGALEKELAALDADQQAHRLPQAKEGDCKGQQLAYDQNRQFLKRRLDLMTKYLPQFTTAWTSYKGELKARVAPFQKELAAIHYGDDVKRPEEKHNISLLGSGQQYVLMQVQELISFTKSVYDLNQQYVGLQQSYNQPFACELATCFPALAQVTLPNGQQVAISEVRAGDLVLGYNAATGQVVPTRVQRLDVHNDSAYPLVQLTIGAPAVYAAAAPVVAPSQPAVELLLTPNHPLVLSNQQTRRADAVEPADEMLQLQQSAVVPAHLTDRQAAGTVPAVYNLRTETGNYFVQGVLVGAK